MDEGKVVKSLHNIAAVCGTDKHRHGYCKLYDQELSSIRLNTVKLLEIGISKGFSLAMWAEYFPEGEIIGLDTTLQVDFAQHPRITVLEGDQADKDRLEEVGQKYGPFDVVVDDGGHEMHQQQTSLGVLFKYIKPGGIYVIEDLHLPHTWWGRKYNPTNQITTWELVANYKKNGTILSPSISEEDQQFLLDHIQKCDRWRWGGSRLCYFRKRG